MISRKELKTNAKCNIRNNVMTLFFINFLVSVSTGRQTLLNALNLNSFYTDDNTFRYQTNWSFLFFPMCLVSILIFPALLIGQKKTYLQNAQGEKTGLKYLMAGFSNYGNSILLYILTSIFTMLWSLLLIIPGIIKMISYSMAPYILAENPEISALEAINLSKRMTDGHKWELFTLYLSFFWWIMLCVITFGVAVIYVGPYMEATVANFYIQLKNDEK